MLSPFLLCVFIVLRLVAGNLDEVSVDDASRALPALLVVAFLLLLTLWPIVGRFRSAAVGVSLLLIFAFTFEAIVALLPQTGAQGVSMFAAAVLGMVEIFLLFLVCRALRRLGDQATPIARTLTLVTLALALLPVGELLWFAWRSDTPVLSRNDDRIIPAGNTETLALRPANGPLRDIYLIVLDAYTRDDVLRQTYGYDNQPFLRSLEQEGFQVADSSFSNYLSTKLVLPSLLNMRYLDALSKQYGSRYRDVKPLVRDIQHNRVVESLRRVGYRIVNIQSDVDYAGLANPDAVVAMETAWWHLRPLELALVDMTPLRRWRALRTNATSVLSPEARRHRQVVFNLGALGKQAGAPGPKFVFAHIMSPHDPFVFGRNGELQTLDFTMFLFHDYDQDQQQAIQSAYADQVHALNRQVLAAIRSIKANSSIEPIILLMGDHGLRFYLRDTPPETCLRESFAILYAMHLPGAHAPHLSNRVTPVNGFRTIFDAYFGTSLGPLPDKAYFAHRKTGYYNYKDVTKGVETCEDAGNASR